MYNEPDYPICPLRLFDENNNSCTYNCPLSICEYEHNRVVYIECCLTKLPEINKKLDHIIDLLSDDD